MSIILLIITIPIILTALSLFFFFRSKDLKKRIISGAASLILIFVSLFLNSPYILSYKGYERKVVHINDWWVSFEVRPSYYGGRFVSYYKSPYSVFLELTSKSKEQEKVYLELLDFGQLMNGRRNSFYQKNKLNSKQNIWGFNKAGKTDNFFKESEFRSYSTSISNLETNHNPIYIDMRIDFRGKRHVLNVVLAPERSKVSIESRIMDAMMGI